MVDAPFIHSTDGTNHVPLAVELPAARFGWTGRRAIPYLEDAADREFRGRRFTIVGTVRDIDTVFVDDNIEFEPPQGERKGAKAYLRDGA